MRGAPDVQEAAKYAPQELALAESERAASKKAAADGDMTAAGLYAGQAVASYTDAVVLARLARATLLADQAKSDLARDEGRLVREGARERGGRSGALPRSCGVPGSTWPRIFSPAPS